MTAQHDGCFFFDAPLRLLTQVTMALGSDTISSINLTRQYYFSVSGITQKSQV